MTTANESTENMDITQPITEQPIAETVEGGAPPEAEETLYAGKYKSVEELEKGYRELSRLVREKRPEAPETYEAALAEIPESFRPDADDPLLSALLPVMKEHGVTQEQATALMRAYSDHVGTLLPDPEAELAALGPQAQAMLDCVDGFVRRHFSAEEQVVAGQIASTAAGVRLLYKLARIQGEKPVPVRGIATPETAADLRKKAQELRASDDFRSNREAQATYDELWQRIARLEK